MPFIPNDKNTFSFTVNKKYSNSTKGNFSNINRVFLYFITSMNFFLIGVENSMLWNYIWGIVGPKS